jgi:hypothetical protein
MGDLRRRQIEAALREYAPRRARIGTSTLCLSPRCDRRSHARDLCRKHYLRFLGQHGDKAPRLLAADLDPKIDWESTPSAHAWYLAGLLEGEGTFSPGPPSSPSQCHVSIEMCERDVVQHARELMGGCKLQELRHAGYPAWRTSFKTVLGGRRAEGLMRELRPLMGIRRQAEIDRALACRAQLRYLRLIPAPSHCVIDGCLARPRGRGLCHKHYMRWSRHEGSSAIRESRKSGASMK